MEECVKSYLEKNGYKINKNAHDVIKVCDDWYANREIEGFHNRKTVQDVEYNLRRLGFAKRCCSDDAVVLHIK